MAAAFDVVDRIDYSALGWNNLIAAPIQITDGRMTAPETPGHGVVLKT